MAELGLPQPEERIGIRGNPETLPTLKPKEQLIAPTSVPGFVSAFNELATTPTALGQLATQMATNASQALATKWGYESGQNPHGNPIPAITKFDQRFNDSYTTQSQNTLGLQANQLLIEGQNELNKSWRLTPDMISSYNKNMQEGLSNIYQLAPDSIKGNLALQYQTNLMRSTSALNNKMITQQHREALQKASIENNNQLSSIYETGKSGDAESARLLQQGLVEKGNKMLAAGMISPAQAETIRKSAQTSYYTGVQTGQALKAFKENKVDEYLSNFLSNKPKGLTSIEWENVAKNVLNEVKLNESLQQRNETSLYSEGNRLLNEGTLSADFIQDLESQTTDKAKFNDFMAHVAVVRRKNQNTKESAASLIPSWTNTDVMAVASKKSKNDALIIATQDVQTKAAENHRDLSPEDAEVEAMSTVAVPIPAFTEKLNRGFLSGNPSLMLQRLRDYNALMVSNPKVLMGMDSKSLAMKSQFEYQLEGNEPDVAAERAMSIVQGKNNQQLEMNTNLIKQWESSKVKTAVQLNSWASSLIGDLKVEGGETIDNLPAFAIHAKGIMKSNLEFHNGNVDVARKDTIDALSHSWGVTEVNGKKQFVFQPIEATIGLDSGAVPLIKEDIYEQLKEQIEPMNQIYHDAKSKKDKRLSFYYRLPPRPSFAEYSAAATYLSQKKENTILKPSINPSKTMNESDKDLDKAIETIKKYKESQVTIERVHDGGTVEKFNVEAKANPGLQVDENSGIIGSYDISIREENGGSSPLNGFFRGPLNTAVYKPNSKIIRQRYTSLTGIDYTHLTAQEIHDIWIKKKEKSDKASKVQNELYSYVNNFTGGR